MANQISFKLEGTYDGIDAIVSDALKTVAQLKLMHMQQSEEQTEMTDSFTTITISNKMRKSLIRLAKLVRQKGCSSEAAAQDIAGTLLSLLKK